MGICLPKMSILSHYTYSSEVVSYCFAQLYLVHQIICQQFMTLNPLWPTSTNDTKLYPIAISCGSYLRWYTPHPIYNFTCQIAILTIIYLPSSDSLSESWLLISFLCSRACSKAACSLRGNREASSSSCIITAVTFSRHNC